MGEIHHVMQHKTQHVWLVTKGDTFQCKSMEIMLNLLRSTVYVGASAVPVRTRILHGIVGKKFTSCG